MEKLGNVYTVAGVSEILQLSAQTVQKFINEKQLRAYKMGHQWRVLESDLIAFIQAQPSNIEDSETENIQDSGRTENESEQES